MLRFAFQEASLSEVVASRNVLEKSGFLYRGRTLCWGKDSPIYKVTLDEWTESRRSL
jgi:hypothetical protein